MFTFFFQNRKTNIQPQQLMRNTRYGKWNWIFPRNICNCAQFLFAVVVVAVTVAVSVAKHNNNNNRTTLLHYWCMIFRIWHKHEMMFTFYASSCKSKNVILNRTLMVLSLFLSFRFLSLSLFLFSYIRFRSVPLCDLEPKHLYHFSDYFC